MEFFIEGIPAPKPRPKVLKNGRVIYVGKKHEQWAKRISSTLQELLLTKQIEPFPDKQPVRVFVLIIAQRPLEHYVSDDRSRELKKGAPDFCLNNADVDNYFKPIADIMEDCGVLPNDRYVVLGGCGKIWQEPGIKAGAYVEAKRVEKPMDIRKAHWASGSL